MKEKRRRKSTLYRNLVSIMTSKRSRNVLLMLLIIFATLSMFCIDKDNFIRDQYLPFLNNNIVSDFMSLFGIGRYNVTISSWLIFSAIILVALMIIIANIVAPKFIDKKVQQNPGLFSSESKIRWFYFILFYGVIFLVGAAIILVAYFLGAFNLFGANTEETSPFISLLTMIAIFLSLVLIIPVVIIIVYLVLKLVFMAIGYLYGSAMYFSSDVQEAQAEAIRNERLKAAEPKKGTTPTLKEKTDNMKDNRDETSDIFPTLSAIDEENKTEKEPTVSTELNLEEFINRFQSFAINKHRIYYEKALLRQFMAGLASSRLIILEGLSGTGKSMLPRMFKEFTHSNTLFTPVQPTWRDKTDVLGFYSEFTGSFKATVFLERLYAASYSDKVNMFILDEMNLSRVEYYFADFLSVLEYPQEDWKIKAYIPFDDRKLPERLTDGFISIPSNTWFVGTANTDDSTYTITDKVCDRAIILNFEDRFSPIESDEDSEPINISAEYLTKLFDDAINNSENRLNEEDIARFNTLCDRLKDRLDILFGNRIMVQIENFVPVYVALGGTKEEALDFMFAKKILRRLEGKYEAYLKDELIALKAFIESLYGKDTFKETERFINKMLKKLV